MRSRHSGWLIATVVAVGFIMLASLVWASPPASDPSAPPLSGTPINVDQVDGFHAVASSAGASARANKLLAAGSSGKFPMGVLPTGQLDSRYLVRTNDTFYYVPGAELVLHWDDATRATLLQTISGVVWVRKTGSAGPIRLVVPISLPSPQNGRYIKLVNFRVYYKLDNASSYIDAIYLLKLDATTGGHITLVSDGTDLTSTSWTSYQPPNCTAADCVLSWPTGGFVTVVLDLQFAGTGDPHDIGIGGVLMRVAYQ